jgi:hypothetical protein
MEPLKNTARRARRHWLAMFLIAAGFAGAAEPVSEYQLKAVFLFNFTQFVEWPAAALPAENAPFVIGVLGADPFGATLDGVVKGETEHGHALAIERYRSIAEIRNCQILFIPASELTHMQEILATLKGRSVLTVTDADDPSLRGVIIGLIRRDNRIRMRIDLQAAKASNLIISSKLLRPAEIVGPES